MRITGTLVIMTSSLFLAGCAYERPPVVYTTPGGQVISAGPTPQSAADNALETSLRAEMNQYGDLAKDNPNLQINANNGTVTLSGQVRNDRDRQVIDTLVRNTPGVASVNDQLHVVYPPTGVVTPPSSVTAPVYPPIVTTPTVIPQVQAATTADQALANRIQSQLQTAAFPSDWLQNVTVRASNGAVYLQGYVASQQERQAIDAALQRVPGVTAVYDQLQLR